MAALFIYWYLCTELLTLLGGALRIYLINYIDTISSSGLEFVTALESEGGNPDWTVLLNGNVLEIASVLLFPCTRQTDIHRSSSRHPLNISFSPGHKHDQRPFGI